MTHAHMTHKRVAKIFQEDNYDLHLSQIKQDVFRTNSSALFESPIKFNKIFTQNIDISKIYFLVSAGA